MNYIFFYKDWPQESHKNNLRNKGHGLYTAVVYNFTIL